MPLVRDLQDGWFAWIGAGAEGTEVRVHAVERADGRCRLDAVVLEGAITAEALRSVPVGRIEAAVNAAVHAGEQHTARTRRPPARIAARLRANAVPGYPDEFYAAVADAYRSLAATSPRPIQELAGANDVPATTAQRWVKEARRRGLLPPGRPGTAG